VNAADPSGRTPLHKAAATGKAEVGRLLVDAGAEPLADTDGNTPLHVATWSIPCPPILEVLHRAGVDVNTQNADGATALHMAAGLGRSDDAEWLLKHGARTDLKEKWGRTPLDLARHAHHEGIEKLLRKHAASKQ
jgi:ankyrin repeat protein